MQKALCNLGSHEQTSAHSSGLQTATKWSHFAVKIRHSASTFFYLLAHARPVNLLLCFFCLFVFLLLNIFVADKLVLQFSPLSSNA